MANNDGIGGIEVKLDANEAFADIPQNRTLIAEKLTAKVQGKTQVVHGLETVDEVFAHFKPEIAIDFQNADGVTRKETLQFTNLGDFGVKGITEQSEFLKDYTSQKEEYLKIIKQLRSNKTLRAALADPDAKAALLDTIYAMIAELKNSK